MFGAVLAHLFGDYVLQSDYMAAEKTKRWWPAIVHATTYGIPFIFVTRSPLALLVMIICDNAIHVGLNAAAITWF